jgi:hypothetical protein
LARGSGFRFSAYRFPVKLQWSAEGGVQQFWRSGEQPLKELIKIISSDVHGTTATTRQL